MALSPRQTRLYKERVTIHREDPAKTPAGKALPSADTIIAEGVPCHLEASPSQAELQGFLQAEGDNVFTLDKVHFEAGTDLQSGDILEFTTAHASIQGDFWRVRGDIEPHTYRANKLLVIAARLTAPPAWVNS